MHRDKAEQEENLTVIREQIAQIDEQLADSRIAKDLYKQRRELEASKAAAVQALAEVGRDTLRWIGRRVYLLSATVFLKRPYTSSTKKSYEERSQVPTTKISFTTS